MYRSHFVRRIGFLLGHSAVSMYFLATLFPPNPVLTCLIVFVCFFTYRGGYNDVRFGLNSISELFTDHVFSGIQSSRQH